MKRQLKKSVVYGLYGVSFLLLVSGAVLLGFALKINVAKNNDFQYVSKGILDYEERMPVVVNEKKIIERPYTDTSVKVVRSFYDYEADAEKQEKSLVYYQGTYMPSSGVAYSNGDSFDVVSIYSGKVTEVKEDPLLGNIVIINHDSGLISMYQSITDIKVSDGDTVLANQVIGKSSTSNISTELGNHLYFELMIDGESVNPEDYYGKTVDEL